jgi:predicted nucleotidyltransferase
MLIFMSDVARVPSEELPAKLAAHPEIAVAYLFGSQARGDAWGESDVDIGLVYRSGPGEDARSVAVGTR